MDRKYIRTSDRIKVNAFNSLFGETVEAENIGDRLEEIPLCELHEFKGHPFHVRNDEEMNKLVESIREYGVLHPGIARPMKKGKGYELISGHRRKHASEIAGKEKMPIFIRNYTDDEAVVIMVDSNLQREKILPSEKAKAYRMKYDALKHQGRGAGLTLENMGQAVGENWKQVQRFIRLSYLNEELLMRVDDGAIKVTPAVNISYLRTKEQESLAVLFRSHDMDLSLKKTEILKRQSREHELSRGEIERILEKRQEESKLFKIAFARDEVKKYFHDENEEQIREIIIRLLDEWQMKKV